MSAFVYYLNKNGEVIKIHVFACNFQLEHLSFFRYTMGFIKILADYQIALNQVNTNHAMKLSAS
jgi:hypothetical protein